jgi:hypothetical protein
MCCRFRRTDEATGPVYQCWQRICRHTNVFSRFKYHTFYVLYSFVAYLLNLHHIYIYILWRNRPMRELLKFRNLKERDCATVAERCRVLPSLPSHRFAPHRVFLGYAVNTGSRNSKKGPRDLSDVMHNSAQRCVLRMSDSSVCNRVTTEKSASVVQFQFEVL